MERLKGIQCALDLAFVPYAKWPQKAAAKFQGDFSDVAELIGSCRGLTWVEVLAACLDRLARAGTANAVWNNWMALRPMKGEEMRTYARRIKCYDFGLWDLVDDGVNGSKCINHS